MKGLLLKDLYMIAKYCRLYIILSIFFCGMSLFNGENLFLIFYPSMLCGMIPVNLLAYDERSKWLSYSRTMPYTDKQVVASKYLIGLSAQGVMLVVTAIAQVIRMTRDGVFDIQAFAALMIILLAMSLISSSISLPFMFKLGVEKGRMAYFIAVGFVCAFSVIASKSLSSAALASHSLKVLLPIIAIVAISIYALSWYLSVVFYKKREI